MAHELLLTTIHSVDGIVLLIFAIVLLKRTLPNTLLQQHLEQYRYLPSPLKSRAIIILSLNTPPTSLLGIISIVKKRIYIYTNSCRPLCEILTDEMISCRTFAGGRLYSRSSKGFETRELWTSEISKFCFHRWFTSSSYFSEHFTTMTWKPRLMNVAEWHFRS